MGGRGGRLATRVRDAAQMGVRPLSEERAAHAHLDGVAHARCEAPAPAAHRG